MNTKEAIDILVNKAHRFRLIERIGKKKFLCYSAIDKRTEELTGRELIKIARRHSSDSHRNTIIKSGIKEAQNEKGRAILKQIIHNNEYDKLSDKKDVFKENYFNHD